MTPPLSPEVEKAIKALDVAATKIWRKGQAVGPAWWGMYESLEYVKATLAPLTEALVTAARRDERRKALLEACAAVCRACAKGAAVTPPPPGALYWYHAREGFDCAAGRIRALLVVEGEPEQKEGA